MENRNGKILTYLREQRGLKQREVAEQLGVHYSDVSKWESGKRIPNRDWTLKLTEFFGCSSDIVLGRIEPHGFRKWYLKKRREAKSNPRRAAPG